MTSHFPAFFSRYGTPRQHRGGKAFVFSEDLERKISSRQMLGNSVFQHNIFSSDEGKGNICITVRIDRERPMKVL